MKVIQAFQDKVLGSIVEAPWLILDEDLDRDLAVQLVSEVIKDQDMRIPKIDC